MIKHIQKTGLLGAILLIGSGMASAALTPKYDPAGHQDYIFFENTLDKEYFIASYVRNPRFSGSNVWNKFRSEQDSLGYMGTSQNLKKGFNVDFWMEDGKINGPYQGIRCRINNTRCPPTGYIPAQLVNSKGAFKMIAGGGVDDGGDARASFAPGAYEHFKNKPVDSTEDLSFHACQTQEDYNPSAGQFCKDASRGSYWIFDFNLTKKGHVTLYDTKAFQEIWYGTDGTIYLNPNARYCQMTVVKGSNGVVCKMLKYNAQGNTANYSRDIYLHMITDNAAFNFTPAAADLQIDGGNGVWRDYNDDNSSNRVSDMLRTGDNYISVFFNQSFFKKLAAKKVNIRNIDNLFTFALRNRALIQSGFYQFSVATKIELIPREYSVSIQPKGLPEGTTPVKSGMIGSAQPITFDYVVKQSAPRQADTIKAYVNAVSVMKNGESYCSFKSADNKTEVPIPAWLSMQNSANQEVKQYSGCDINKQLDMRSARWSEEPWDSFGSGYFYRTDLKLIFPMDQPVSQKTVTGANWGGTVRAEGEIRVEAQWNGVTFP